MQGGQPVDSLLQPADSAETWQIAANHAFAAAASPNLVRCSPAPDSHHEYKLPVKQPGGHRALLHVPVV